MAHWQAMRFRAFLLALPVAALALHADDRHNAAQQAWQILNKSLSGDSVHKREALLAVATVSGRNTLAVKACLDSLKDKDPLVRQSAALALGEMKATAAVPALKQALDDTGEVAFAAAKALSEIGDPAGRNLLITVLEGERKDIKPGMMTSAVREGKEKLRHPGELVFTGAEDATGAMFGPAAIVFPAVKDALDLKGKGAPGRAAAAAYLARDPDPDVVAALEWALNDDNQFVRLEAARGLGQRGSAKSIPPLQPLLDDTHNLVRDIAAASIIRIEDRGGAVGRPVIGPVSTMKAN